MFAKNQGIRKCPSHTHITPFKGRCIKDWGHVRDIRSPSRLPHIFGARHSRFHYIAKIERKWNVKSSDFCRIICKQQNIFVPLQSISKKCKAGKQKSWITREKHHEKPANDNCTNNFRLTKNYGRKILSGSWTAPKCSNSECAHHRAVSKRQLPSAT